MLHCFKKHKSANDTTNEIYMVYGNGAIRVHIVHNCFSKFRAGNFNLEDEERPGRPSSTDTDVMPRYTVRELADALKIHREQPSIIIRLGYVNCSDVWLPHELTEWNIFGRVSICDLLLQRHKNVVEN